MGQSGARLLREPTVETPNVAAPRGIVYARMAQGACHTLTVTPANPTVTPAKAGVQGNRRYLDSRVRGNDSKRAADRLYDVYLDELRNEGLIE